MAKIIELTPNMISNTAPSPYVISSSSHYGSDLPYKGLYNQNYASTWKSIRYWWYFNDSLTEHWWKIDLGEDNKQIINSISLASVLITGTTYSLKSFSLYGSNDDTVYNDLLDIIDHPNNDNIITYNFNNTVLYRYYKIVINNSYYGAGTIIGGFGLLRLYHILNFKFLIKQNLQYYSIKPDFYQNGQFSPITLIGGETPNDDDFNNNGFDDVNDLCDINTIKDDNVVAEDLESGKLFTFDIPNSFKNVTNIS